LDLIDAGRKVRDVAHDLGISEQTIYVWRKQHRIDQGLEPGLSSGERAELAAARRRIVQVETNALGIPIGIRNPSGTLIHSGQGTQFTSWAFTHRAKASGLVPSMGSIGDCYDNAKQDRRGARHRDRPRAARRAR
jgi:transposase InsO family protein